MKWVVCGLLLLTVAGAPIAAQTPSLAAIAKQEEERRKSLKGSGKVYTNDDLRPDITKSEPAPPAAPPSTPEPPASLPEPSTQVPSVNLPGGNVESAGEEVKDQVYWRSRMDAARAAVERTQIFADALQSRLNALNADIVNRDDPAQRAQLELERQRVVAELDRVKKEMAQQTKAISDIEEEARKAGVPAGWLRAS